MKTPAWWAGLGARIYPYPKGLNLGLPPTDPGAIPLGADTKKLHLGGGGVFKPHDAVVVIDFLKRRVLTERRAQNVAKFAMHMVPQLEDQWQGMYIVLGPF